MQSLQTGAFIVRAWYLLYQTMSLDVVMSADPADVAHRLRMEAARAMAIIVPAMLSTVGLWQARRWAYWLCVVVTVGALVAVISGMFEGISSGGEVFGILLPLIAQLLFSLLPETRAQAASLA